MSHALFSILPLMIGVFGGTISVIVVIKNVGNERVRSNLAAIKIKLEKMVAEKVPDKTYNRACAHRNKVEGCRAVFGMCTLIPVILFAVWIIIISFCVSLNGDCIEALNSPYNRNSNKTDKDVNQAEETDPPNSSLYRRVVDNTTKSFGDVLLSAHTITFVTLIDLFCIVISLIFLRRSRKQYDEIDKIYKIAVTDKTGNGKPDEKPLYKTGGSTE